MIREEVLAELQRQNRLVSAKTLAFVLDLDLDDVHAALLDLAAEGLATSMTDRHAMTTERWGYNRD